MITLLTTDKELNHLQHAVNEAREDSLMVKINKTALSHLLHDHYKLNAVARNKGEAVEAQHG